MCDSKGRWMGLLTHGILGYAISDLGYKKAKKKDAATINAANQAAANQVEQNKLANSVQTTENTPTTENAAKKITTQRVPLNTSLTGASTGSQTSVGLNLGGY